MAFTEQTQECPAERLIEALGAARASDDRGLVAVDELLVEYPADPRLHFLRGSLLASLKDYNEARQAMVRSVEIAPDYAIARFQLGLLELSSGEPALAEETWGPLQALPSDSPLRLFATGLGHLIRDEFGPTIELLEEGIARNTEAPDMNRDMQLFIDECRKKLEEGSATAEPVSATQMLLQQFGKGTKH